MLLGNETLHELRQRFPTPGTITWIGVRPKPRSPVRTPGRIQLKAGHGIQGDHRAQRGGSKRQVTLLQHEHLAVIAALTGQQQVDPAVLRRNVVISGIAVVALKDVRFRLGTALLKGTGPCHPCSRMEQVLGSGGYNAMRGHGGLTAIVLEDGEATVGDAVQVVQSDLTT
jgi:MOSC domain-containing protein YiiM